MIKFLDVYKRFGDGTVALDEVNFHIEPGEFVVVTGPSGSGKTTLMKLLIKDISPTRGDVLFEGESLSGLDSSLIPLHRRKVGVVFQDYRLLPELNVWENIALPLSISGKSELEIESRITDLLNLVSLGQKALMFPKQLSGGEAQRVGIARALATGPGIIFADEPTGNLDKKASLSIVKLLRQINELGTTIILSTHDVVLLDFLKELRKLELEGGKLVGDGGGKKPKKKSEPKKKTEKKSDEKPDKKLGKDKKSSEDEKPEKESKQKPDEKLDKKSKRKFKLPFFGKKKKKSEKVEELGEKSDEKPSKESEKSL